MTIFLLGGFPLNDHGGGEEVLLQQKVTLSYHFVSLVTESGFVNLGRRSLKVPRRSQKE